jgi:trk/ktr system potassium uptake protein
MRLVFVGASEHTVRTARILLDRGHDVVIIEADRAVIDALTGKLDCGFLHGDGSKPAILREADPKHTDVLFCLTNNDKDNIIASLVGRSLGFQRVVTSIEDPEFDTICVELGLENTIIPSLTIGRYLADMAGGTNILELSTAIKGDARVFAFVLEDEQVATIADLDLPADAKAICFYRKEEFVLAEPDSALRPGDEVIILTHSRSLPALRDRWAPVHADEHGAT